MKTKDQIDPYGILRRDAEGNRLSIDEAAKASGRTPDVIRRLVQNGLLPSEGSAATATIARSDLDRFLEAHGAGTVDEIRGNARTNYE